MADLLGLAGLPVGVILSETPVEDLSEQVAFESEGAVLSALNHSGDRSEWEEQGLSVGSGLKRVRQIFWIEMFVHIPVNNKSHLGFRCCWLFTEGVTHFGETVLLFKA